MKIPVKTQPQKPKSREQQYHLTDREARTVRIVLENTAGWLELAEAFPAFRKAVNALPHEQLLYRVNPMLRDLLTDAVCRARRNFGEAHGTAVSERTPAEAIADLAQAKEG